MNATALPLLLLPFSPFLTIGLVRPYHLDESISSFTTEGVCLSFISGPEKLLQCHDITDVCCLLGRKTTDRKFPFSSKKFFFNRLFVYFRKEKENTRTASFGELVSFFPIMHTNSSHQNTPLLEHISSILSALFEPAVP